MGEATLKLPPDVSAEEARVILAMKLYEAGRLSLGKASELAGHSKRTFMEMLGKAGVAVFDHPADELADEVGD
jgi:predicted HTH domain antitoxin